MHIITDSALKILEMIESPIDALNFIAALDLEFLYGKHMIKKEIYKKVERFFNTCTNFEELIICFQNNYIREIVDYKTVYNSIVYALRKSDSVMSIMETIIKYPKIVDVLGIIKISSIIREETKFTKNYIFIVKELSIIEKIITSISPNLIDDSTDVINKKILLKYMKVISCGQSVRKKDNYVYRFFQNYKIIKFPEKHKNLHFVSLKRVHNNIIRDFDISQERFSIRAIYRITKILNKLFPNDYLYNKRHRKKMACFTKDIIYELDTYLNYKYTNIFSHDTDLGPFFIENSPDYLENFYIIENRFYLDIREPDFSKLDLLI